MQAPLVYHEDYHKHRKSQKLSLRRYCLLRDSILTNNARDAAAQAGQTIILTEGCSANKTTDAHFLLLSLYIEDYLNIEWGKFAKELD